MGRVARLFSALYLGLLCAMSLGAVSASDSTQFSRREPHPKRSLRRLHTSPLTRSYAPVFPPWYLYVWCGPDDKTSADFLAVFNVDTFGLGTRPPTLLGVVKVPTQGNEPHHLYLDRDGKNLYAGGLLSGSLGQDSNFFFSLENPREPQLVTSSDVDDATAADAAYALPNGGFLVTMMSGRKLGDSGRVVEYDANYNLVAEYPSGGDVPSQFYPHGIAVNEAANYMVTTDFVDLWSTLEPSKAPNFVDTVRVWDLHNRTILHTLSLGSDAQGIMDVVFVEGTDCDQCAIASSASNGKLYLIDPINGIAQVAFDTHSRNSGLHVMAVNRARNRIWVTAAGTGHVYMLDASLARNLRLLSSVSLGSGAVPHFITLSPDESMVLVSDYFLEQHGRGMVHSGGDRQVHFIQVEGDAMTLLPDMSLDFKRLFSNIGIVNPHGMATRT
ncbi:hypothetical protein H4R34_000905 [Dimargaris verticillata]|uniref:Methanethiol oxidase n=1 Tax=Dimargaris verticillata TaxID=2761393 RepID=A0A9W8BAY9_9FUNG|nr:hypothetical protein H4R34_000905 [Dimargaris verticillata]